MPCAQHLCAKASCVHAPPAQHAQSRKRRFAETCGSTLYSASSSLAVCAARECVRHRALLCPQATRRALSDGAAMSSRAQLLCFQRSWHGTRPTLELRLAPPCASHKQEYRGRPAGSWKQFGRFLTTTRACRSEGAAAEVRWDRHERRAGHDTRAALGHRAPCAPGNRGARRAAARSSNSFAPHSPHVPLFGLHRQAAHCRLRNSRKSVAAVRTTLRRCGMANSQAVVSALYAKVVSDVIAKSRVRERRCEACRGAHTWTALQEEFLGEGLDATVLEELRVVRRLLRDACASKLTRRAAALGAQAEAERRRTHGSRACCCRRKGAAGASSNGASAEAWYSR